MKIIVDCDQENIPAAMAILDSQLPGWRERYNRVGWGWVKHHNGTSFFVRRITDGLSVKQIEPKPQIKETVGRVDA